MKQVVNISVVRQIKGLERSISEYTKILNIKKDYIIKLQVFIKYSSIEAECRKVKSQIDHLVEQIGFMKKQLENKSKERNE